MSADQQLLYRIWLNDCCDYNPKQVHRLLEEFGTAEAVYHTDFFRRSTARWMKLGQRLRMNRNLENASRHLERCREEGIRLLSIDDEDYPARLKEVFAPPQILYVLGDAPDLSRMMGIGVVGTREGSDDGLRFAEDLGRELAVGGVVVVSGMAIGTDAAAHRGALSAGGKTVAVLAGGVDIPYPRENEDLYRQILRHGCVVSEQPPGVKGRPYFYQDRNRILVGLSHGVVVVEGTEKSGTAMTARLAQEANADLFVVPGNPRNPYAALPNSLLRDGGTPITEAMDLLEEYIGLYPEKLEYGTSLLGNPVIFGEKKAGKLMRKTKLVSPPHEEKKQDTQEDFEAWLEERNFSAEEKMVLRSLQNRGGTGDFDEIAEDCKLETGLLSSHLILLQMRKAVVQKAGGQYELGKIGG